MLTRILTLILIPTITCQLLAADKISFSREIRPLLSENCFFCHGPDAAKRKAELRLDQEKGARIVIKNGDQSHSLLMERLLSVDPETVMPPPSAHRTLTREQIELIGRWIDEDAPWGEHWSFAPLTKPQPPTIDSPRLTADATPRNSIDAFVRQRLAMYPELQPAGMADRNTLIRRLTLDLTGLPPPAEDVDRFVGDPRPDAYERWVDRLLASPNYGQRMAWDWLDAARYADSNGYQGDNDRTMWPWRDWVVNVLNAGIPFDQFTIWQLAGDLIQDAPEEAKLATAFLRNHMINGEGGRIAEENRVDYVMDMAETTGTIWLGLTINCCRCHDHKYDPLSQKNYYQLNAFFNQTPVNGGGGNPQTAPTIDWPSDEQKTEIELQQTWVHDAHDQLKRRQHALDEQQATNRRTDTADETLAAALKTAEAKLAELLTAVPKVMVMEDIPKPRKTYILTRGLYNEPGEVVEAAIPESLPPMELNASRNRLGLAQWLVSNQQPLTARVTVNRLWQLIFGRGLVKTVEDFGAQSEFPLHGELLDHLAADFRDHGWDLKRLVRTMVTSHVYRQSSRSSSEALAHDPENRLLARAPRYRLPSWMLRDQALAASGLLIDRFNGPSVNVYQPDGVWEEATFGKRKYPQNHGAALYRRSLYVFWRRIVAPTMFFDNASRQSCTVNVLRTNTPLHALSTLNDPTYVEAARALSVLTLQLAEAQRLSFIFRRVLAREPTPAERELLMHGLGRSRERFGRAPEDAKRFLSIGESALASQLDLVELASWTSLCLAVFNLDETLTKE